MPHHPSSAARARGGALLPCTALLVLVAVVLPRGASAMGGAPADPVLATVQRIAAYMRVHEQDGVTRDLRLLHNPSEEIRLSVVSQLLAYCDLYRVFPSQSYRDDIASRSQFLLDHLSEARSRTPFDGMLGYGLLCAYDATGDPRALAAGRTIAREMLLYGGWDASLNWGLMAGMAVAKYYALSGDPAAPAWLQHAVDGLASYQRGDGALPHYCTYSMDLHYSGWIGMELLHIRRYWSDAVGESVLNRLASFLADHVGPDGRTFYGGPCDVPADCPVYSLGGGCTVDYDTRGWTNELGYTALALDHVHDARYGNVMGFLHTLENIGAFPDKWDYMPAPNDPLYAWAIDPRSVIRTSVIFWSLATLLAERQFPTVARFDLNAAASLPVASPPAAPETTGFQPWAYEAPAQVDGRAGGQPADAISAVASRTAEARDRPPTLEIEESTRPMPTIRFVLPPGVLAQVAIFDLQGRAVRELFRGEGGGEHRVSWDGRGDRGFAAPGIYFVRLTSGPVRQSRTIILLTR